MLSCVWLLAVPWTVGKGPSVNRIFQAKILEWVAIPFFRGSSQPRDQTRVSCIVGRFFTIWATRKVDNFTWISSISCCAAVCPWPLSMKPAFLCVCTNALDNGLCLVHNLQDKLHSEVFFWVPSPDAQPCSKKRQDYVSSQPEALCFLYNLSQVESFPQTKGQKLMWRAGSLEKTLMLGIAGKRRRGQQRMRQLNSITSLMAINLSKFWKMGRTEEPSVLQFTGS